MHHEKATKIRISKFRKLKTRMEAIYFSFRNVRSGLFASSTIEIKTVETCDVCSFIQLSQRQHSTSKMRLVMD